MQNFHDVKLLAVVHLLLRIYRPLHAELIIVIGDD